MEITVGDLIAELVDLKKLIVLQEGEILLQKGELSAAKKENVALKDAVIIYPLEQPSRTVHDDIKELKLQNAELMKSKRYYINVIEDFSEYGNVVTTFKSMGANDRKFEMPYEIFEHYYGDIDPYNSPLPEWFKQPHIIQQKERPNE